MWLAGIRTVTPRSRVMGVQKKSSSPDFWDPSVMGFSWKSSAVSDQGVWNGVLEGNVVVLICVVPGRFLVK